MEPKTIEIAALGRPLYPGMLYDCRSDSFITVCDPVRHHLKKPEKNPCSLNARFSINLKTGPKDHDDIALHFDNRITYVVCNSFRNGKWETESNTNWCPFAKGAAFDVFMVVKPEGYEVIVNGQECCMFKHCMPMETVSTFEIYDDVFMNTFGIIEADNINLRVTIPTHVWGH